MVTFREGKGCDCDGICGRISRVADKILFCVLDGGYKGIHIIVIH